MFFKIENEKIFVVVQYLSCIEMYKIYKLKWEAYEYTSSDILDILPCEIYSIKLIGARNRVEAIKKAKKLEIG